MNTGRDKSKLANENQSRDTGLAMVLLCLLIGYIWKIEILIPIAIGLLILTMIWPSLFKPLAIVWFGLARFIGNIVSMLVLGLLFFLVVTPIGLIRRLAGKDPMLFLESTSLWMNQPEHFTKSTLYGPDQLSSLRNYLGTFNSLLSI